MKIYELESQCLDVLRSLVNKGSEVCNEFESTQDRTYSCKNCGYSQYIHLCKQVVELEENE